MLRAVLGVSRGRRRRAGRPAARAGERRPRSRTTPRSRAPRRVHRHRADGARRQELPRVLRTERPARPRGPRRLGHRRVGEAVVRHGDARGDDEEHRRGRPVRHVDERECAHHGRCGHRDDAQRPDPGSDAVAPGADQDAPDGPHELRGADQQSGRRRRPPEAHQPDQPVRRERELRHDEQHRHEVHPPQEPGRPVRVRGARVDRRGRRRCPGLPRPWGIDDADGAEHGEHRAQHERQHECGPDTVRLGQQRHRHGSERHAERLRHLPDAHRETAALPREPPDHDPSARRVRRGTRHARRQERDPEQQWVARRDPRRDDGQGGQRESAGDHHPFADAVGHRAPGDEGEDEADRRGGREQSRRREGHPLRQQVRDEQRRGGDDEGPGGLCRDAEREHGPRPGGDDGRSGGGGLRGHVVSIGERLVYQDGIPTRVDLHYAGPP